MQRGLTDTNFYLFEGVNAYREGNRIPSDALYYAENSRFVGGRWSSRKGYTAFGDELSGGSNIKGLMEYTRFPGGIETPYVMAYYNSQFERFDVSGGTPTSITPTGWTATDTEVEGVSYNGDLFVCDGSNLVGKINDTAFSTIAGSPSCRIMESWANKMWGVDNVAPATVQYTATATAGTPANIEDWTGGGSGAQLVGKGGRIESLRNLKDRGLYIFKQNQIDVITNFYTDSANPVPNLESVTQVTGAINHRSTTIVENDIWFVAPNLEIRSLGNEANYFEEQRVKDMSVVIQRYKSDLDSDQSGAVSWYNDGIYKLALKQRGSSQNNIIFSYDRDSGGWGFDFSTSPQVACTADGKSFFGVSGNNGQLYRDENGYSDNGFPMRWAGKTGLRDDGQAKMYKYGRYLHVRGVRSEGVVITGWLLGEDFERLEEFTITEPTAAEIAAGAVTVGGLNPQIGDIVGGEGYTGEETGEPPVYRFNRKFSIGQNARMFGIEFKSSLLGQRASIDEAALQYIPRGDGYTPVDA